MNNVLWYLEKTANQFPEQIAVADENTELTYSELRNRTQEIGAKIHKEEGAGNPIGILADRSCETIIAILSVLYSGNYYLPIDPALPERKFLSILQDSGIHLLIVPNVSDFKEKCNLFTGRIFFIANMQCSGSCPKYLPLSEDLPLCLMYTSGSTGKPKGVLKSHKAICSYSDVLTTYEMDENSLQEYWYHDIRFFIHTNKTVYSAVWSDENILYELYGAVTEEELMQMIHSIAE